MNKKKAPPNFVQKIGTESVKKIKSKKKHESTWFGLGMMGLIGWSVVVPTLLGAALGIWLDKRTTVSFSWTLTLLVVGLCIGCLNAWHWMSKQHKDMQEDEND